MRSAEKGQDGKRWEKVHELTYGEIDRGAALDLAAIVLGSFLLYALLMLPGVGWGEGAELQARAALYGGEAAAATPPGLSDGPGVGIARRAVQDVFLWPAGLFVHLLPFGTPAWRFNVLMALLSSLTLAILYLTMRLVVVRRTAAALGAVCVVFSHAYFLQAVRPSPWPFLALLFAAAQHQAVRHLLLGETFPLISLWVFSLTGVVLAPELALAFLAPAFFVTMRDWTPRSWIFWCLLALTLFATVSASALGIAAYPVLAAYLALQYPVLGWLLAGWGGQGLARRLRPVGELVVISLAGAAPLAVPAFLPDALGALLPGSLAASLLVGVGADFLVERIRPRRELATYAIPILFVAAAVLPLITTMAVATSVRAGGIDRRIDAERPFGIELRDNPWCDAVWYALWPPKYGQGGNRFVAEAERVLPSGAFLLADPDILPVVGYAQRVEGRLRGLTAAGLPLDRQASELARLVAAGHPVFLAGIDPEYYAGTELGMAGEIESAGNFYRWIPSPATLESIRADSALVDTAQATASSARERMR